MPTAQKLTMANAHAAVIFAARHDKALMDRFATHGNPAVRKAAEIMAYLAGMADQETARHQATAENALYYMPMPQIEELLRAYAAR